MRVRVKKYYILGQDTITEATKMAKMSFFLLLIVMQSIEVDAESCFFRMVEEVQYQPVPLEVPQERSITSCGLACMVNPKCFFFAISGKTCVLSGEIGRDKYDQDDKKFTIYKKV